MPDGRKHVRGDQMILQKVSRNHRGVYECTGTNENGDEFKDTVSVIVTCELVLI